MKQTSFGLGQWSPGRYLVPASALLWALLLSLGGLWGGRTIQHRPVQRTALDTSLSSLRTLRADEAGVRLYSATPAANTCVMRIRPPGGTPEAAFVIASYGRGAVTQLRPGAAAYGLMHNAMVVGLPGEALGFARYTGLSRVSFGVWQWQSPELWPPNYWRAAWARKVAEERRVNGIIPEAAASDVQSRAPETFSEEMLRINREHHVSDSDRPEPHRLNVVTDEEIPCEASVPHCRRFRAHLVADGAPVELEERCSDAGAASNFSAFGSDYLPWH